MRPPILQCTAHRIGLWVSASLRHPLRTISRSAQGLHTSRVPLISVADRIKQFLPADATEEEATAAPQPVQTIPVSTGSGLSAFAAEIKEIDVLVTQGKLASACKQLLDQLPLHVVLSALVDRIVPLVHQSPISDLGIFEIAYHLHLMDQSALASQLLQSVVRGHSAAMQMSEFELVRSLAGGCFSVRDIDLIVQEHTGSYFPQILQSCHSRWLKTRLLAALNDKDFDVLFRKWSRVLLPLMGPTGTALLVSTNRSTAVYSLVKDYVLHIWDAEYVNALVRATTTDEGFSRIWLQLRKRLTDGAHLSSDPVLLLAVPSVLKVALRLRRTYDSATICHYGAAQLEGYPTLVAKALLAAAFAQRRPRAAEPVVSSPKQELQTFLVRRSLAPVAADPVKCDRVIAIAASRFKNEEMPGRVFWQLVLSLPAETILGPRSSRALAPIASSRPYVEQLRYMALPVVTSMGVCELLRLHIDRIVTHRRLNRIPDTAKQAEDDVNFLMAGMVLASEKIEKTDSEIQERELAKMVDAVFEPWRDAAAARIVTSTAFSNRAVASTIVQQMVRLLVNQKSYAVALQVLRLIEGPQQPATLELLLMGIAQDIPHKSYATISWLLRSGSVRIPRPILDNVLIRLCRSSLLSESQLKNQFQGIRRLMLIEIRTGVGPEAAKALVDALIQSAMVHRKGSRTRLRWALDVAKMAKVPKSVFTKWTHKLQAMQEEQEGYWAV